MFICWNLTRGHTSSFSEKLIGVHLAEDSCFSSSWLCGVWVSTCLTDGLQGLALNACLILTLDPWWLWLVLEITLFSTCECHLLCSSPSHLVPLRQWARALLKLDTSRRTCFCVNFLSSTLAVSLLCFLIFFSDWLKICPLVFKHPILHSTLSFSRHYSVPLSNIN